MGTLPSNSPSIPAKEYQGDPNAFTDFMRKLVKVPHSEIKAQIEAEKTGKRPKTASRASVSSPKRAD